MDSLSDLPNVGKVLENNLRSIGVETVEELRSIGAEEIFIRIRVQVDPCACLHMLYGIQGAIDNIPDRFLSDEVKRKLKEFYKSL